MGKITVSSQLNSLSAISQQTGVDLQTIESANPWILQQNGTWDIVHPGDSIEVPGWQDQMQAPTAPAPVALSAPLAPPMDRIETGAKQFEGTDTSNYQTDATFQAGLDRPNTQFAVLKATEGTGYQDPTFKARWDQLGQRIDQGKMTLRVAYMFLHRGDGAAQAKYLLDYLGINGPLPAGARVAIDWEAKDAMGDTGALKAAADTIRQVTGQPPIIYTYQSKLDDAKAAVPDAPLWPAIWNDGKSQTQYPFVQYSTSNNTLDLDVFNGTLTDLCKLANLPAPLTQHEYAHKQRVDQKLETVNS